MSAASLSRRPAADARLPAHLGGFRAAGHSLLRLRRLGEHTQRAFPLPVPLPVPLLRLLPLLLFPFRLALLCRSRLGTVLVTARGGRPSAAAARGHSRAAAAEWDRDLVAERGRVRKGGPLDVVGEIANEAAEVRHLLLQRAILPLKAADRVRLVLDRG